MSKVIFLEKKIWGRKTVLLLSNISWERYGITICYFFLYIFVIIYIKKQHNFMLPWSVSLMSGIGNCYILVVIFYDFPLPSIPTLCCCFWHYIISVRLLSFSLNMILVWCPWISFTYNTFIFMEMKSYFNNPTSRNEVFRKICVQEQIIKIIKIKKKV